MKHYCERKHGEVCEICDAREARRAAAKAGRMLPYYIIAEGISRHYGGHEEGGWWYDRCQILEVRKAYTFRQGLAHARELREMYPQPRYGRGSCANRGEPETVLRVVYGENDPRWPEESHGRPHYD